MKFFSLKILGCCFIFFSNAYAWDNHQLLTRQTLVSFKKKKPAIWNKLQTPIQVNTIEQFLRKVFQLQCTPPAFQASILRGVGKNYKVLYAKGVEAKMEIQWASGISRLSLTAATEDPAQNLHEWTTPFEVLSVYSDEPDWLMDDDVPRLKGIGLSKDTEGTATRVLRHFWYKGEKHFGVDFGEGQETDERVQLFYELSLIAFEYDQPYWGYRFLANALHYLQDLAQPFHVKGVMSTKMLDVNALIKGAICDSRRRRQVFLDRCEDHESLSNAIIKNGWAVAAYHASYEDFALGIISNPNHAEADCVSDFSGSADRWNPIERFNWQDWSNPGKQEAHKFSLLNLRSIVNQLKDLTLNHSPSVGRLAFTVFGSGIKDNPINAQTAIMNQGKEASSAYQSGKVDYNAIDLGLSHRHERARFLLIKETAEVLSNAGYIGRALVEKTLEPKSNAAKESIHSMARQLHETCYFHDL